MEREEYSEELRHEHAEEGNFNKQVLSQEDYNRMSEFGALIAQDVSVIVKPYCLDDPPDELGTPGSMEIPLLTKCKNCGKDLFGVAQVFECPECGGNHLTECVENVIIHFPVGRVVLYGFESRSRKAPYFDFSQATLSHYECANPECGYIPLDETGSPIDDDEKLYDWLLLNSKHSQEAEQDEESSVLTITEETEVQIAV